MPDHLRVKQTLVAGIAEGPALILDEPLSFWGGLDPETGRIIDRRHPQAGQVVSGTVLVMPTGRGSSSAASVLAEAIRRQTAPNALVLQDPDEIIVLGAIVAEELYGLVVPVVWIEADVLASLDSGQTIRIDA